MNKKLLEKIKDLHLVPFRWGGVQHEYEKTALEWRKDVGEEKGKEFFTRCWCCGNKLSDTKPVYVAYFFDGDKEVKLRVICRKCAYGFERGVIESDQKSYMTFDDFKKGKVAKYEKDN